MKKVKQENEAEKKEYTPKIISVFGTKGGTGKTTIAVNMAIAMQKEGRRVALIDLDLQFGDVGVFMDVPKVETISDLVMEGNMTDENVISYLFRHSSGVQVLCAPNSPELAEVVKPEHIKQILLALKNSFDCVVIDMGPAIDEISLQALDLVDYIYFVTNPEISTLKNTKVCLSVLTKLNLIDKVKMVLNKDGDSFVKKKNMEDALDMEMALTVTRDCKNAISAINRGVPIVLADPKSKISKEMVSFVKEMEI